MIENILARILQREFPFEPTGEQQEAIEKLCRFVLSNQERSAFILRGYAGTGKTTLIGSLVTALDKVKKSAVLMAPTGRAAKVFSSHAGHAAYTIHKVIYRQKRTDDQMAGFTLNFNKMHDTLFIVDEASMIGSMGTDRPFFGSGKLLDDLIEFVYSGKRCKLLLMGDTAQLPPVGEELSAALTDSDIAGYDLHVESIELTEVMRQSRESGILSNATTLRQRLAEEDVYIPPTMSLTPYPDIYRLAGGELLEALQTSYDEVGQEGTIVITRSNKQAIQFNNGIRFNIFGREESLCQGDVVMIAKNNYYWTEQALNSLPKGSSLPMDFIANGDTAIVENISQYYEFYDLHFADVTLSFPDYDGFEMDVRVILDALQSETPALPPDLSEQLFQGVMADYEDYPTKRKRMEKLRQDPNYNAVQIKYAYAVTCHKAQGGGWNHVYVNQGWIADDAIDAGYYRWLYTALTRATQKLYLINWKEDLCE